MSKFYHRKLRRMDAMANAHATKARAYQETLASMREQLRTFEILAQREYEKCFKVVGWKTALMKRVGIKHVNEYR